jgi:hypothetical protein
VTARLLAAALLACASPVGRATAAATTLAPAARFDHVTVTSAARLPAVDVVAWRDGAWRSAPGDVFPAPQGGTEIHLRARDLGASTELRPAGARWIVRARKRDDGETRHGFLVPRAPDAPAPPPVGRLDATSFAGRRFGLVFPDGSGFYRELRVGGAEPLVHAIRLRVAATLPGGIELARSEEDFRWSVTALEVGALVALRRSSASARALLRYTDPRPQAAVLGDDVIEQRIRLALPAALLALAREVTLENGFEVDAETMVLVPGASTWQPASALAPGAGYIWIALASGRGALVHRLVAEDAAVQPTLYVTSRDDGTRREVGYRVAHAERAAEAGGSDGFVLGQHVALLGDAPWARALIADETRTRDLARELEADLGAPPPAWQASLEELPR